LKKAIAKSKTPIHIKIKPKQNTTVNKAPTSNIIPAVENKFTLDSVAKFLNARQAKNEETMRDIHATANMPNIGPTKPKSSVKLMSVLGDKFGRFDQSPLKPGHISELRSER